MNPMTYSTKYINFEKNHLFFWGDAENFKIFDVKSSQKSQNGQGNKSQIKHLPKTLQKERSLQKESKGSCEGKWDA